MNRKLFNIKIILVFWLVIADLIVFASPSDSCKFQRLIPTQAKIQFAGNIGFISAGPGYQYAKRKIDLDFLYGFVPENLGGPLHSLTIKNTWTPFKSINISSWKADLLTLGIPLSYTFGEEYFFLAPKDQYPQHYYDYSSALRIGIFAGGRMKKLLPDNKFVKEIALYYEFGTYDLVLHNYYYNVGTIPFVDIFNVGIGLQFRFGE